MNYYSPKETTKEASDFYNANIDKMNQIVKIEVHNKKHMVIFTDINGNKMFLYNMGCGFKTEGSRAAYEIIKQYGVRESDFFNKYDEFIVEL